MNFKTFLKENEEKIQQAAKSIPHLHSLLKSGWNSVSTILNNPITVVEKVDGMAFSIKKTPTGEVEYWSKNNRLDRAMVIASKDWSLLITRLEKLRKATNNFSALPNNSIVSGEFIKSSKANTVSYNTTPKGHWVIFFANIGGKVYDSVNYKELHNWSNYFQSSEIPVLFEGVLSDEQRDQVDSFLTMSDGERLTKFRTQDFTTFIINILRPDYTPLLGNKIEGIVIYSDNKQVPTNIVKMVDPAFSEENKNKWEKNKVEIEAFKAELLEVILEFITPEAIEQLKKTYEFDLSRKPADEGYVFLIDKLFLMLSDKNKIDDIINNHLALNNVEDLSDIDSSKISPRVMAKVGTSWFLKELYILMLIIFRKEKVRRHGIFRTLAKGELDVFNDLVMRLQGR